jgi:hypothetical protein
VILAFAWAAYPYTDLVLQSNSNDSLVAALLIWGLVAFSSVGWRAILIALAAGAKFVPLLLVPLYATGHRGLTDRRMPRSARQVRLLYFGAVFASVCALVLLYPAIDPGLATAWERTVQSQLDRSSPFSIWGQVSWLQPLQTLLTVATIALAAALALIPRRRTLVQVAALSAAVIISAEITLEHWFYLYIPWFFGMLIAAIAPDAADDRSRDPAPAISRPLEVGRTIGAATSPR